MVWHDFCVVVKEYSYCQSHFKYKTNNPTNQPNKKTGTREYPPQPKVMYQSLHNLPLCCSCKWKFAHFSSCYARPQALLQYKGVMWCSEQAKVGPASQSYSLAVAQCWETLRKSPHLSSCHFLLWLNWDHDLKDPTKFSDRLFMQPTPDHVQGAWLPERNGSHCQTWSIWSCAAIHKIVFSWMTATLPWISECVVVVIVVILLLWTGH